MPGACNFFLKKIVRFQLPQSSENLGAILAWTDAFTLSLRFVQSPRLRPFGMLVEGRDRNPTRVYGSNETKVVNNEARVIKQVGVWCFKIPSPAQTSPHHDSYHAHCSSNESWASLTRCVAAATASQARFTSACTLVP